METKSGRSSRVSFRSTSSSRISRPGSAVDLLLERMGAIHAEIGAVQANIGAEMQANMGAIHGNMGAIHADLQGNIGAVQENLGAVQENIGAVGAAQVETREVLETVIHRLERLEASPAPKFVAGLDLNPSLSSEMTTEPHHSTIGPEIVMRPGALRRSEK